MQFNLTQGLNSIGIYKQITPTQIKDIVNQKVEKIFTIVNGIWQSWINGVPDEFQGFLTFEKGYGYTIVCSENTTITINDNGYILTANQLPIKSTGINYIAGIESLTIQETMFNRYKQDKLYTIVDGRWESWQLGVPDEYQGVLQIEIGKGYVINVTELLFETYQPAAFPYMVTFGMLTKQITPDVTDYSDYSDVMSLILDS